MSSTRFTGNTVRFSTADARVLRGLIKAFHPEHRLVAFDRTARSSAGTVELPLSLYLSVWSRLRGLSPNDVSQQLRLEGVHPRDFAALLLRLGLPVTRRTLDRAGHSVWSMNTANNRVQFHYLYTPAGTRDDALQAFRTAFFPDFSSEEWGAWQSLIQLRRGRYVHPALNPYDPELSVNDTY